METITLWYWVYRDDVKDTFPVEISKTETIAELKKIIKDETPEFRDVETDELRLYSIPILGDDDERLKDELKRLSLADKLHLKPLTEVSTLLPMPDEWLIVVDGPDSDRTLNCWVRGDGINDGFKVDTSRMLDVTDLKNAIKNKRPVQFQGIAAESLFLYKVSILWDEHVQETLDDFIPKPEQLLSSFRRLSDILADPPLQGHLHIVVEDQPFSGSHYHSTQLQVEKQDDFLTAIAESFRLATTTLESFPSKAAKSSQYFKIQSGDKRIFDCRCASRCPVNTVAPPIQLFNEAFAYFSSNAFNSEYIVPDEFVLDARAIMAQFALIHARVEDRRGLRPLLQMAIDPHTSHINPDGTAPGSVGMSSCGSLQAYLIINEENELGDGGPDPSTQAAFSFQRTFSRSELCMKSCCPAFIIAHAGPWLTIMGGIITNKCIIQRLTDFIWVPAHSTHDDDQCLRIARVLYVLKESIRRLKMWYETIKDVTPFSLSAPRIHHRFFPSPDAYRDHTGGLVKFTYQRALKSNISCVTYLAKTIEDSPQDVVVKFVTSYGEDAHNRMASLGFAPQLLYCGPINVTNDMPSYGSLHMVVIEYVRGFSLEYAMKQRKVPRNIEDELRNALKLLHEAGYVFGDLREPNVIVTREGRSTTAQLIDFDWAGKEGEAKYPALISGAVDWPKGVRGLGPILKTHDNAMLDILASHCSRYQAVDPKGKRRATEIPPGQSPLKKTAAGVEVDNM